jgi:hypothetical protein
MDNLVRTGEFAEHPSPIRFPPRYHVAYAGAPTLLGTNPCDPRFSLRSRQGQSFLGWQLLRELRRTITVEQPESFQCATLAAATSASRTPRAPDLFATRFQMPAFGSFRAFRVFRSSRQGAERLQNPRSRSFLGVMEQIPPCRHALAASRTPRATRAMIPIS